MYHCHVTCGYPKHPGPVLHFNFHTIEEVELTNGIEEVCRNFGTESRR